MALQAQDGRYLKVDLERCVFPGSMAVEIYKSKDVRLNRSEFDFVQTRVFYDPTVSIARLLDMADPTLSILDNLLVAIYKALKTLPELSTWEDC